MRYRFFCAWVTWWGCTWAEFSWWTFGLVCEFWDGRDGWEILGCCDMFCWRLSKTTCQPSRSFRIWVGECSVCSWNCRIVGSWGQVLEWNSINAGRSSGRFSISDGWLEGVLVIYVASCFGLDWSVWVSSISPACGHTSWLPILTQHIHHTCITSPQCEFFHRDFHLSWSLQLTFIYLVSLLDAQIWKLLVGSLRNE